MKMEIEIIPEDFNGLYCVKWNDTLCSEFKSDWDYLQKRPYELNCYITNRNNDTLGYYGPMSFQQQIAYFKTIDNSDSIVNLNFKIGVNPFSTFLDKQSKGYIDKFNESNKEQTFFKSIQLDLNSVLKKEMEIELIKIKN